MLLNNQVLGGGDVFGELIGDMFGVWCGVVVLDNVFVWDGELFECWGEGLFEVDVLEVDVEVKFEKSMSKWLLLVGLGQMMIGADDCGPRMPEKLLSWSKFNVEDMWRE